MEASQDEQHKQDEESTDEHVTEQTEATGSHVVGDSGLQPLSSLDQSDANRVGPTSAPPPGAQSGVPLAEDRAAGVEPNPEFRGNSEGQTPDGQPIEQPPEGEGKEQDGSES